MLHVCSDFWPHQLNHNFIIYVYTFIVAVLFLGPQDRPHNFALTAFWGYWWPGIFLVYPFLGRIWCSSKPSAYHLLASDSRLQSPLFFYFLLFHGSVDSVSPSRVVQRLMYFFMLALLTHPNPVLITSWLFTAYACDCGSDSADCVSLPGVFDACKLSFEGHMALLCVTRGAWLRCCLCEATRAANSKLIAVSQHQCKRSVGPDHCLSCFCPALFCPALPCPGKPYPTRPIRTHRAALPC